MGLGLESGDKELRAHITQNIDARSYDNSKIDARTYDKRRMSVRGNSVLKFFSDIAIALKLPNLFEESESKQKIFWICFATVAVAATIVFLGAKAIFNVSIFVSPFQ